MERLSTIEARLDEFFRIDQLGPDPAFGRFIPMVYDPLQFDWKSYFEPSFASRFNGLMLKGAEWVGTVYCSVFPTAAVLEHFIESAAEGDLLFLHHPLDIECGDPRGETGRGFIPIDARHLDGFKRKRISFHSCHAPMDIHPSIGTTAAIVEALNGSVEDRFWPYGDGHAGAICAIEPMSTHELIEKAKGIFDIPYVDVAGLTHQKITKVALVAGAGYKVGEMRGVEARGAQAYLTGEIFDRIDNEYGRRLFNEVQEYARITEMSLVGVSHAASEYLVMKTQMVKWFEANFGVRAELLPLSRWWR